MAAALSRVYAGLCRRDRLTSKECPFWFYSLFCDMIERKLNLELSNVFPRLKFLAGCGQFSDFSNKNFLLFWNRIKLKMLGRKVFDERDLDGSKVRIYIRFFLHLGHSKFIDLIPSVIPFVPLICTHHGVWKNLTRPFIIPWNRNTFPFSHRATFLRHLIYTCAAPKLTCGWELGVYLYFYISLL
jgi:hypothetical protein